ncbi:hypothetical protein D9M71_699080 [compost metagenome]
MAWIAFAQGIHRFALQFAKLGGRDNFPHSICPTDILGLVRRCLYTNVEPRHRQLACAQD